jgi:hypothetical protein
MAYVDEGLDRLGVRRKPKGGEANTPGVPILRFNVVNIDIRLEAGRQARTLVRIRDVAGWAGMPAPPQPQALGPSHGMAVTMTTPHTTTCPAGLPTAVGSCSRVAWMR